MNKTKLISMVMMVLIVSLPVYSASALAYLDITKVSGENAPDNYAKKGDKVTIEVDAHDVGTPVNDAAAIRYGGSPESNKFNTALPGYGFDSCVDGECSLELEPAEYATTSNPQDMKVYMYKCASAGCDYINSATEQLTFDEIAPVINSFAVTPAVVSSGDVTFNLNVNDLACTNTGCAGKCSGINRINLSAGSLVGYTIYVYGKPGNYCPNITSIIIPLLDVEPAASGGLIEELTATIKVYDNVGLSSTKSANFKIDTTLPLIEDLRILSNGRSLDWIGSSPVRGVEVSVNVTGDNIDTGKVVANLTMLNIDKLSDYNKKQAACSPNRGVPDSYRCVWSSVIVKLDSAADVPVIINASDTAGNMVQAVFTPAINYDNIKPEIISIAANKERDEASFIGSGNNRIIIQLKEEGTGLYNKNMRLDLREINPSLADKQADECAEESAGVWTCYFNDIQATGGDGKKTIKVLASSSDDLGNAVNASGIMQKEFVVDRTAPSFTGEYSIESSDIAQYAGLIKTGDKLFIEMNITETSYISGAYADLSSIISGADKVSADECNESSSKWTCSWETDAINIGGEINDVLKFSFIDAANNTLAEDIPIAVLYFEGTETVPDYWEISRVACSPNRFDREITRLIQAKTYCHVSLKQKDPSLDLETLKIDLSECVNNSPLVSFIAESELMNDQRGSKDPYIRLTLIQEEAKLDKIDIKCPLKIISRAGSAITSLPETDEAEIELSFYNNPLGEISNNIKSKIEDVDESIGKGWKIIGSLEKIMNYAVIGCKLWDTLKKVVSALQGIMVLLGIAEDVYPASKAALMKLRVMGCEVKEEVDDSSNKGYTSSLNKLCNFVNCKMGKAAKSGEEGTFNKLGRAFGGGKGIFGPDSLGQFAGSLGGGEIQHTEASDGARIKGGTGLAAWTGKDPREYMDVKNSLVLSAVTLCVPGIIHNLDKWRQVQCMYGVCLLSIEGTSSVPVSFCEAQKDYLQCKFVYGEMFRIFPYTAFFDYYINMIKNALYNPLSWIGIVLGLVCKKDCKSETVWLNFACSTPRIFATIGEAGNDISGIIDLSKNKWQVSNDYCAVFQDMKKQFKQASSAG